MGDLAPTRSGLSEDAQASFDAYDAHQMFEVSIRAPKARPELFRETSRDEYLALLERADETERFEWVRGWIVQQQATQTRRHAKLERRIENLIERQLDLSSWQVIREYSVWTGDAYRITDVVIDPADADDFERFSNSPAAIFEVGSKSSVKRDTVEKPLSYGNVASLKAYVVVHHDRRRCLLFARAADGTFPTTPETFGDGETFTIAPLDVTLSIDDIYRGILDRNTGNGDG